MVEEAPADVSSITTPTDDQAKVVQPPASTSDKVSGENRSEGAANTTTDATAQTEGGFVLRPWHYRALYVAGQLFVGFAIAAALYGTQARVIRKISFIPSPASSPSVEATARTLPKLAAQPNDRSVLIQSAVDFRDQGILKLTQDCTLEKASRAEEMVLRCKDIDGVFLLGFDNATINGEEMPVQAKRDAIWKALYGAKEGQRLSTEERWKRGRILD
ncbi:predicted protein [Sparassis crispa]|uniref:Uncharacterized protein n=1 Tax=Sparassis crispa TaxID=139825 RepID=A0A401GF82_9APHY|nr:predicted protein [Sparassis crispa]GBE80847.1 predicted protein [Sparassis crispa]